jgi:hypothetical protein
MSSTHHIPFPRAFLSLNTPTKKAADGTVLAASPESEFAAHGFLSNRAIPINRRQTSVSSVGSVDSIASAPSSPPASESFASPILDRAMPAFLALNSKFEAKSAPPPSSQAMNTDTAGFLSNRH